MKFFGECTRAIFHSCSHFRFVWYVSNITKIKSLQLYKEIVCCLTLFNSCKFSCVQASGLSNVRSVVGSLITGATLTTIWGSIPVRNPSNVRSARRTFPARPLSGITWRYITRATGVCGCAAIRKDQRTNQIPRSLMNSHMVALPWSRYAVLS